MHRWTDPKFVRLKCERHRFASLSLSLFIVQKAMPAAAPGEGGREGDLTPGSDCLSYILEYPEKGIDPWLTVPIPCSSSSSRFRSGRSAPSTIIFKFKIPLQQEIPFNVFKTVEVVQQDGIDLKVDRRCLFAPDSMNGFLIWTLQEAGWKCPCCGVDQQQWDLDHPMQSKSGATSTKVSVVEKYEHSYPQVNDVKSLIFRAGWQWPMKVFEK